LAKYVEGSYLNFQSMLITPTVKRDGKSCKWNSRHQKKKKNQTEEIRLPWLDKKEKRVWQTHCRYPNNQVSCTKCKHYDYKTLIVGPATSRKKE